MKTLVLEPFFHKSKEQIGIRFEKDNGLQNVVKRICQAKWSQSNKFWYVPLSRDSYDRLCKAFNGKAELEITALKQYLQKRRKVEATKVPVPRTELQKTMQLLPTTEASAFRPTGTFNICNINLDALHLTIQQLVLKAYSASTIKTYRGELLAFFQQLGNHPAHTLTTEDVKRYLEKCLNGGFSENTLLSRINALKFYYEKVLGRDKFFLKYQDLRNISSCPRY